MNAVLADLGRRSEIELDLLFSKQWLGADGKLPESCPLRELPLRTFPWKENITERLWKLTGWPKMDHMISDDTDWVYCPMETRLPVTKCPVAVTIHDIQAFEPDLPWSQTAAHRRFRRKWATWIYKTLQECRVVFTVSEYSKQRMVELLGADPDKIVVSGNGLDAGYLRWEMGDGRSDMGERTEPHCELQTPNCELRTSNFQLPTSTPYILIVGGLRDKKGARWTLDVAKALKAHGSALRIVVAGPNDPLLEAEGRALGNFDFLGWVDDADLPQLNREAIALLFLSPYEGFGIPAIEAMAVATPAVVANRASLPEVVGNAGYIVEPDQSAVIAELLQALESGAERYDVEAGKAWALQFSWSRCADRVLSALQAHA
jgi:glycosyltransferase involved in cell wall biosynthesis